MLSDTHGLHEAMKQEGWCFVAGTLIKTEEGSKAIEEIEVGDLVYARNTETGEEGYKEVVRLFPNSTQELIHVAIGDTVIDTTPAHRFWVEGKDFLPARDLQVGDRVLTASGELKEITSIERESLEEPVPVYNFEVKDWHTYYVSGEEILVHNTYESAKGTIGETKKTLLRGDKNMPENVFENGFVPKGTHNDPLVHNQFNSRPGNYISTTTESSVAEIFATGEGMHDGYIYIIHSDSYIDMNGTYGTEVAHPNDKEFLIPNGINSTQIEGAIPISSDMMYGEFIPNPYYRGVNN